jgi:hypothetical protein
MRYYPCGPIELPRDDGGLIFIDPDIARSIWKEADESEPGLSKACGCYVYAIRAGRGIMPWYVGKAVKQTFDRECLTDHKLVRYNSVLS